MSSAKDRVYEALQIVNDVVYEAERGKISWEEALRQLKIECCLILFPMLMFDGEDD